MKERTPQKPRKSTYQKTFEVEVSASTESHLAYYIKQELNYYNSIVENLTPRLRAFPQDFMSIKDREKKLWEVCAEYAVDPQKLVDYPLDQWPVKLRPFYSLVRDQENNLKITPAHLNIFKVAASPAKLHASVRKSLSIEILKHMIGQSETLHAGLSTETLKVPMQMLQTHTIDTKRHLQIPGSLVKVTYDADANQSKISIPYSTFPLIIEGHDITENAFKSIVVRAPHPSNTEGKWCVDLKDHSNYLINLTDHNERRKRR